MFASTLRSRIRRRGIILVVVLGMLALLALVGVTFATFSNQARINARNRWQSGQFPTSGELMDYALTQLIEDTSNPQSVIRGHSLKRDMYGKDALYNGALLNGSPDGSLMPPNFTSTAIVFQAVSPTPNASGPFQGLYACQTNIPTNSANASSFYPFSNALPNNYFQRWIVRVPPVSPVNSLGYQLHTGTAGTITASATQPMYLIGQTFEIMADDATDPSGYRVFYIAPPYTQAAATANPPAFPNMPLMISGYTSPELPPVTPPVTYTSTLPVLPLVGVGLQLDGRFLRAFNGPGMGALFDAEQHPFSEYANYRYNGADRIYNGGAGAMNQTVLQNSLAVQQAQVIPAYGNPDGTLALPNNTGVIPVPDMDEDYDACDLENWFLAIQSADGQVVVPSFHRPGLLTPLDWTVYWTQTNGFQGQGYTVNGTSDNLANTRALSRILRPRKVDGHNAVSFPDLTPDPTTGKITFDVDNDGDGLTDSVWLDLGYPPQSNTQGQYFKPLFAFTVIGLNGRIPLNTAGNLQNLSNDPQNLNDGMPQYSQASHLGYSPSEIDMTFALQNAFDQNFAANYYTTYTPANGPPAEPPSPFVYFDPARGDTAAFPGAPLNAPFCQVDTALNPQRVSATVTFPPTTADLIAQNSANDAPYSNHTHNVNVALTQLRNILTGTRLPDTQNFNPNLPAVAPNLPFNNQDANVVWHNNQWVLFGNNVGDAIPGTTRLGSDFDGNQAFTLRSTKTIAGRWGEESGIPTVLPLPSSTPNNVNGGIPTFGYYGYTYNNPVRAGRSYITKPFVANINQNQINGPNILTNPIDACDDNHNAFDMYPVWNLTATPPVFPESADYYDSAGQLAFASERIRRFVTPIDASGDGRVQSYAATGAKESYPRLPYRGGATNPYFGSDAFGRIGFAHYFRPPGIPITVSGNLPVTGGTNPSLDTLMSFTTPGAAATITANQTANPNSPPVPTIPFGSPTTPPPTAVLMDQTNNRLHGFESFRNPFIPGPTTPPPATNPYATNPGLFYGATPIDYMTAATPAATGQIRVQGPSVYATPPQPGFTGSVPTYTPFVNSNQYLASQPAGSTLPVVSGLNDGEFFAANLHEADEMNIYSPTQEDAPFNTTDLEWLYRLQDVDGGSLYSRLAYLAPLSFLNPIDGLRRRRLFALDTFDTTTFSWAPDNTAGNQFGTNANFTSVSDAGLLHLPSANPGFLGGTGTFVGLPTPQLAHRDRRINLNYPLPVSNSPIEPVRQKWIRDTYTLLKSVLPPKAVDTPEELAQLSQYVVNMIDFRDPDCTATKFVNTDITVTLATPPTAGTAGVQSSLAFTGTLPANFIPYDPTYIEPPMTTTPAPTTAYLIQYGMEYNPVAINEVMAYQFNGTTSVTKILFELVNTLMEDNASTMPASSLDLTGWDLVVMKDDAMGRPDPFTGQIPVQNQAPAGTHNVYPLWFDGTSATTPPKNTPPKMLSTNALPALMATTTTPDGFTGPPKYYRVYGSAPVGVTVETKEVTPDVTLTAIGDWTATAGIMPGNYYWLYVRRPANPFDITTPFDPDQPNLNRVVVDSFRFIFTKGVATAASATPPDYVFSLQRLQPNRGGQAVPPLVMPAATSLNNVLTAYGYSEQTTYGPVSGDVGMSGTTPVVTPMLHTLGLRNVPMDDSWDYFPFNDRDYTSIMELLMVPSCPPGLFTKQFTEQAPGAPVVPRPVGAVTPSTTNFSFGTLPSATAYQGNAPLWALAGTPTLTSSPATWTGTSPWPLGLSPATGWTTEYKDLWVTGVAPVQISPHYYPYLNDEFFYSGAIEPTAPVPPAVAGGWPNPGILPDQGVHAFSTTSAAYIGGPGGAGWHKMLEFFEVPSPAFGSIGEVAQGSNYDWYRQDLKPGQLNLNLIIDEEVFLALLGQDLYGALNQNQIHFPSLIAANVFGNSTPAYPPVGGQFTPLVVTQSGVTPATAVLPAIYPNGFFSMPNTGWLDSSANGVLVKTYNNLKGAFSDFLKIRHGGSGYIFAFGNGAPGQAGGYDTVNGVPIPVAADRPFRSLSYPDINYTILRPATLPPSAVSASAPSTSPAIPGLYAASVLSGSTTYPPYPPNSTGPPVIQQATPLITSVTDVNGKTGGPYVQDPGIKNPYLFTANNPVQPPAIPPRRLFQVPDWVNPPPFTPVTTTPPSSPAPPQTFSNAAPQTRYMTISAAGVRTINTNAGGDPSVNTPTLQPNLADPGVNLVNQGVPLVPPDPSQNPVPAPIPAQSYYLGFNGTPTKVPPTSANDHRDHPYYRTEWLQRVANLTTVRTHQYAVWITVGFFEVTTVGDSSLAATLPTRAYDIMGAELGLLDGKNKRYRSFFLLDRTRATGFNPAVPGDFRDLVVYRQDIES
jgi:hypothetical protein